MVTARKHRRGCVTLPPLAQKKTRPASLSLSYSLPAWWVREGGRQAGRQAGAGSLGSWGSRGRTVPPKKAVRSMCRGHRDRGTTSRTVPLPQQASFSWKEIEPNLEQRLRIRRVHQPLTSSARGAFLVSPNQPTNFNHTARLRALPPSMALSTFVAGYHSTADSQP